MSGDFEATLRSGHQDQALGHTQPLACTHCAVRHKAVCAALENHELSELNALARHHTVPAGKSIQPAGEPTIYVANIVEGVVKLVRGLSDGREQIVGLLFGADFLGRTFSDLASCEAVAVTDVKLCSFPQDDFEDLLTRYPNLEERLFSDTLIELERAHGWLALLGRKTASERVATFLLMLADRQSLATCSHFQPRQRQLSFDLPLTRTEIADYLGLTIETVSRQLGRFKKDGLIQIENNRHITIPNRPALAELTGD